MDHLYEVLVDRSSEQIFFNAIGGNFSDYFFYHVDYAQYPQNTEIYMALDNVNQVQAMLLIWKNERMQLRGSIEGVNFLLKNHHPPLISITGYEEHIRIIEKFYPDYILAKNLYRMGMKQDEFKLREKFPIVKLNESHRKQISGLMNKSDPVFWASTKPEDITIDENNTFYGIIEGGKLISIAGLWDYLDIGYIPIVATHRDYWNKGYATSCISSAIKSNFADKKEIFIMVRVANEPAVHTYSKLGFKIRNTQYMFEKKSE